MVQDLKLQIFTTGQYAHLRNGDDAFGLCGEMHRPLTSPQPIDAWHEGPQCPRCRQLIEWHAKNIQLVLERNPA